jgi:hypothetical protein
MQRNLEEANNRFETAAKIDIFQQWISWVEFEEFCHHLNSVLKLLDSNLINAELQAEINGYKLLRRSMCNTPLNPREHIRHTPMSIGESDLNGELSVNIRKLRNSFQELSVSDNPMHAEIALYLSGNSKFKLNGSKSVQLLVPLKFVNATNASVVELQGSLQKIVAMGTTTAKRSDLADVMFLFGSPEDHASFFKHGIERSREVAWIFNAPSARQIVVLQLSNCEEFDSDKYEIWQGSNQFDAKSIGNRPAVFIENYEESSNLEEIVPISVPTSDPIVDALLVRLYGNRFIYFSDSIPPKPTCVRIGEAGVEIDDLVKVSSLRPGDVLLVRTSEASRSFLREHAIKWLKERHKEKEVQSFIAIADTYKKALKSKFHQSDFLRRLIRDGLEEQFVKNQIERAFLPSTIATRRKENFLKISSALELDYGDDEWAAIKKIQTAHQQAGRIAVQELREGVLADESWLETVTEPGIATLNAGAAGEIVLIPVVQKPEQKVQVSIHAIGQLQINQRMFNE